MMCTNVRALALGLAVVGLTVSGAMAGPINIEAGTTGTDGHLLVTVGDMGGFGQWTTLWPDLFDPSPDPIEGELTEMFATFNTLLYLFIDPSETGNGIHRGVATVHPDALGTYPDGTIQCEVDSPNSGSNGDPMTSSTFNCTGDGVDLSFALTQSVATTDAGPNGEARSILSQEYTVTNNGGPIELKMTKHIDEDMPWGGGGSFHTDDLVGADFAELGRPQVYAQDRELTTAALVLRTANDQSADATTNSSTGASNFVYYVGKQNLAAPPGNPNYPGGDCPAHDYGTDFQIWDNYGVPNCWKNFVPGVGYNVPGISPEVSGDTFIGYETEVALGNGEQHTITFETTYGYRPEPTLFIPPLTAVQTASRDESGCATFLWSLKNINPTIAGEAEPITEFYIDVEAGTGADACTNMIPPSGWTVTTCGGPNANGHVLYRFTGGTPIEANAKVQGRLEIETNGTDPFTNGTTNTTVPALSVVLNAAQQQDDAQCNFNFGPSGAGDWGLRIIGTAYLPVPSMSSWAKIVLAAVVVGAGALLVMRSRKTVAA